MNYCTTIWNVHRNRARLSRSLLFLDYYIAIRSYSLGAVKTVPSHPNHHPAAKSQWLIKPTLYFSWIPWFVWTQKAILVHAAFLPDDPSNCCNWLVSSSSRITSSIRGAPTPPLPPRHLSCVVSMCLCWPWWLLVVLEPDPGIIQCLRCAAAAAAALLLSALCLVSSFGSASTICCYECTMRGSAVCSSRLVFVLRLGSRRAATYPVLCPKRCQDVARATVDEGNETDAYGETLIVPRITIKETRAAQIHSISTPGHFSLQIDFPAHWDFPGDTALCDVGLAGWVSRGIEAVWTICDDKGSRWVGLVPTACTTGPGEWKVHE